MSKAGMWNVIVIIVVLAIGAFWYVNQQPPAASSGRGETMTTQPSVAAASVDTSNASLDADLNAIDSQAQEAASAASMS